MEAVKIFGDMALDGKPRADENVRACDLATTEKKRYQLGKLSDRQFTRTTFVESGEFGDSASGLSWSAEQPKTGRPEALSPPWD